MFLFNFWLLVDFICEVNMAERNISSDKMLFPCWCENCFNVPFPFQRIWLHLEHRPWFIFPSCDFIFSCCWENLWFPITMEVDDSPCDFKKKRIHQDGQSGHLRNTVFKWNSTINWVQISNFNAWWMINKWHRGMGAWPEMRHVCLCHPCYIDGSTRVCQSPFAVRNILF